MALLIQAAFLVRAEMGPTSGDSPPKTCASDNGVNHGLQVLVLLFLSVLFYSQL